MDTIFSGTLRRVRKEAGFPTAYRFFHDNGGAKTLGFTYRQYLRMEQGRNLPESDKLLKLILSLRVMSRTALANELATAWLKTLVGEEAYDTIFHFVPQGQPHKPISPLHDVLKHTLARGKYYLNHAQLTAILEDEATFLCFFALTADGGSWSAGDVAAALELTEAETEKAMRRLAKAKILKKAGKNAYRCPIFDRPKEFPHIATLAAGLRAKFGAYMRELGEKGRTAWSHSGIVRADADAFQNFMPVMKLHISSADAFSTTKRTPRSALYLVEGKVTKLRNF